MAVSPDDYNQETADYRDRINDANGTDDSLAETIGNFLAGAAEFHEQDPDEVDFDPLNPQGPDADWSFDPVALASGALGFASGVPIVPGLIADQLSDLAGRSFCVNLGPSVFGTSR